MMKHCFLLTGFIFYICMAGFSQNDSINEVKNYLDRFKSSKLITEEQYQSLEPFTHGQIKTPAELFTHLCRVTFQDLFRQRNEEYNQKAKKKDRIPETTRPGMSGMDFPRGTMEDFERLKNYTASIYKTGIISNDIYLETLEVIRKDSLSSEVQVLGTIQPKLLIKEWLSPAYLLPYVDSLKAAKVVNDDNYLKLKEAVVKGEIKDNFELLNYCDKAIVIYLSKYHGEAKDFYPSIYKQITHVFFPESTISDFIVEIKENKDFPDNGYLSHKAIVSFKIDGKEYAQESFYDPDSKVDEEGNFGKLGGAFYAIFNKILADRKSEYRIHYISSRKRINMADYSRFGLIALKEDQPDKLRWTNNVTLGVYLDLSYENYKNSLTTDEIDQAIATYKDLGLFAHLTVKEIEEGILKVKQAEINGYRFILDKFKNVVIHLGDGEMWNVNQPYVSSTLELSKDSHGKFLPEKVFDTFEKSIEKKAKNVKYGFYLNNKKYEMTLELQEDWIDERYIELISKALKENKIDGEFYYINSGEGMIFLSNSQYNYLKEHQPKLFTIEE